jgi:hypothetical protein
MLVRSFLHQLSTLRHSDHSLRGRRHHRHRARHSFALQHLRLRAVSQRSFKTHLSHPLPLRHSFSIICSTPSIRTLRILRTIHSTTRIHHSLWIPFRPNASTSSPRHSFLRSRHHPRSSRDASQRHGTGSTPRFGTCLAELLVLSLSFGCCAWPAAPTTFFSQPSFQSR